MSDKKQRIMDVLTKNYNISLFSAQGREMIASKLVNALTDSKEKGIEDNYVNPIQKPVEPVGDRPTVQSTEVPKPPAKVKATKVEDVKLKSEELSQKIRGKKKSVESDKSSDKNKQRKRGPISGKPPVKPSNKGFKNLKK
jgi:hypothetical protein